MQRARTILIIGGSQGGPTAAARAREFSEDARILLLERRDSVSWVKAGLRHHLLGEADSLATLDRDRAHYFESRYNIEVRTSHEVVGLDNDSRRVLVNTEDGVDRIGYDAVIFAGGATTTPPHLKNLEGAGVCSFRKLEDVQIIRQAKERGAQTACVLGAGGMGLEAAEALKALGLDATVVERENRVLPGFSLSAAAAAAQVLREGGVKLWLGDEVTEVALDAGRGEGARLLTLRSGRKLETDLLVLCTGMRPRSRLLREAGASVHADGTVRVTPYMETTLPHIYACGTAVSVPHAVTGGATWLNQAAIIDRTAQIAGRNAAVGPDGKLESLSPVAATRLHQVGDHWFARTGLSDAEARSALGNDRVSVTTVHSWSSEAWLSGDVVTVTVVVDNKHRRVVGGEVWGRLGVPRRIDILAAAVLERWSPTRLRDLDVAYAPSLGPAFDPVNAAGTMAQMNLEGLTASMTSEVLTAKLATGEPITLLDVGVGDRGDRELWPEGTVPIPLEELRGRLDELDRQRPVVILSHTGRRAHTAARILRQRGFAKVSYLDGGAISWRLLHGAP